MDDKPDARQKELIDDVMKDYRNLKKEKDMMMPIYEDITRYLYPYRSGWNWEHESDRDFGRYIFDGEAIAAKNRLANGIFGWMVSPNIDWINFEPRRDELKKNHRMMQYVESVKQHLLNVYQMSNFYDVMAQAINDCVSLGTTVVNMVDSPRRRVPVFEALHLREVFLSENVDGDVDVMLREFDMTYRQLMEEFPSLPAKTEKDAKKNLEKRVRVLHAIYPRTYAGEADDGVKLDVEKPFASVYFFCGESSTGQNTDPQPTFVLREGGFDFQRFTAWRFAKVSNLVYGISPGMDALPDIKMINMQSKTMADVSQLAARPPMYADLSLKGNLRIAPGGITYGFGDRKPEPIVTSLNYPVGMDAMERRAKIIRDVFMNDYFMAVSQAQNSSRERTATEIQAIKSEAAATLGTVIGRIQSELLYPIVYKTIMLEAKAGRLPPPPNGFDLSEPFSINFIGPLAQAQKKYLMKQSIETGLASLGQVSQLFQDPTLVMHVDKAYAARKLLAANGYPMEGVRDEQDVAGEIEQLQKQQQQAMAQEQAVERAKAEAPLMAAMGKKPEDGSPLQRRMR